MAADIGNWYFFIFGGCLIVIATLVLFYEKYFGDDDILDINPLSVLLKIVIIQVFFYAQYILITFSVDLLAQEPFWISQVFEPFEFAFHTTRGLATFFSLIIAFLSLALPLTAVVQHSRNMTDYTFTAFTIHFVVVSAVGRGFPANGAWWTACVIGTVLGIISAEFMTHRLEMMSYESSLGGRSEDKKQKKPERGKTPRSPEVPLRRLNTENAAEHGSRPAGEGTELVHRTTHPPPVT